jgi:hypothetical protein
MKLSNNMEFEMKESFIPNISKSTVLRIVEVTPGSVIVQMQESKCRGVFPLDSFQYWIKRNSLILLNEKALKKSQKIEASS